MTNSACIEATRQLTETSGPPVLALTTFDDDELLQTYRRVPESKSTTLPRELTTREREVLTLIARGLPIPKSRKL